ncbi:DUF4240 domain-containing protein [Actinophytocola sp. NPDC049390]|uniref:DUF4240 domain-containing protein n=1 Tax=Actinophytocola sp. NPDC049390 TaxID=3363894 RepID=UPI0037AEB6A2
MTTTPSAADEARFWNLIESAWQRVGSTPATLRTAMLTADNEETAEAIVEHLDAFVGHLEVLSADLSDTELTDLDRVLERKLYDIDRADLREITDGSDDGFLYCRGFVVALGREYYEAVAADPSLAVEDAECESMCYFFAHRYAERHDSFPDTGSGISRETCSNKAGWAD